MIFTMQNAAPSIYSVGHSTYDIEVFILMLRNARIQTLADIRSFPGSKRFPHFNKAALAASLQAAGIEYIHIPALGGRQPHVILPGAVKAGNYLGSYIEYAQTQAFATGIDQLQQLAGEKRVAYMCAEVLWWQCHRSVVSDSLKANGWNVQHIMGIGKIQEHYRPGREKEMQGVLF
jgi:uncharacterized protein (DUF488 family)